MATLIRPELLDWAIQLFFADKRLDALSDTKDRLETLADKQIAIGEDILVTECGLHDLADAAAGGATGTATRAQQYDCAAARANVSAFATINREFQRAIRSYDVYQNGAKTTAIRNLNVALARGAGSAKANAMRNEDNMFDDTLNWRFANIASATGGASYSTNGFAGVNRFYQGLVSDLVGDINNFTGNLVGGLGAFFGERSVDTATRAQVGNETALQTQTTNGALPAADTVTAPRQPEVTVENIQASPEVVILSNDNPSVAAPIDPNAEI